MLKDILGDTMSPDQLDCVTVAVSFHLLLLHADRPWQLSRRARCCRPKQERKGVKKSSVSVNECNNPHPQ